MKKISKKKKILHFISIVLLLFSSALIGAVPHLLDEFKQTIEDLKTTLILKQNKQSKYILEGIKHCTISYVDYFQKKLNQNVSMVDVNMIVDFCASKHRSAGETGDYFTIWDYCPIAKSPCFGGDNSPDCQGEENIRTVYDELIWQKKAKRLISLYIKNHNITDKKLISLTKNDTIIWWDELKYIMQNYPDLYERVLHPLNIPNKYRSVMHNNPELAYKVLKEMLNFFDSDVEKIYFWQFDDAKEYLQWVVVRSHDTNVWGQKVKITSTPDKNTSRYGRLLIAIGFQEDELFDSQLLKVLNKIKNLFDKLASLSFVMGIFTLVLAILLNIIVFVNNFCENKNDKKEG